MGRHKQVTVDTDAVHKALIPVEAELGTRIFSRLVYRKKAAKWARVLATTLARVLVASELAKLLVPEEATDCPHMLKRQGRIRKR